MKKEKRKFIIIIVSLVIIIMGAIGLAFAYFNAKTSSLGQTITVGELDIIYVDGNTLRADNLTPISEKDSETLGTELSFSVKNRGKLDGYFDIQIKDITGDNELKSKDLKWNLIENDTVIRSGSFLNVESSLNILNSEEIKTGETKNYKIVVWIEETNENQSIMQSKSLEGVITINSSTETKSFRNTAIATLNNTKEGSKIKNLRIYGNSVQNEDPTLTSPTEIQSVGDLTKNLFDYTKVTGANIETIENGLKLTGYSNVTNITPEMFLEMTGLKIGDTITTTIKKEVINGSKNYIFGSMRFLSTNQSTPVDLTGSYQENEEISTKTITIPENFNSENYKPLYIYGVLNSEENGLNEVHITDIMISKNGETEYTPYGKYKIPVKISGKNIFNAENNFKNTSGTLQTIELKLKPNTAYTMSSNVPSTFSTSNSSYVFVALPGEGNTSVSNLTGGRTKTTGDDGILYIRYRTDSNINSLLDYWYQLEEGTKATAYEPYKNVTKNIYLDEPLRGIGNYKDYIDFETKTVVRKIKEVELTSNSPFQDTNAQ